MMTTMKRLTPAEALELLQDIAARLLDTTPAEPERPMLLGSSERYSVREEAGRWVVWDRVQRVNAGSHTMRSRARVEAARLNAAEDARLKAIIESGPAVSSEPRVVATYGSYVEAADAARLSERERRVAFLRSVRAWAAGGCRGGMDAQARYADLDPTDREHVLRALSALLPD